MNGSPYDKSNLKNKEVRRREGMETRSPPEDIGGGKSVQDCFAKGIWRWLGRQGRKRTPRDPRS